MDGRTRSPMSDDSLLHTEALNAAFWQEEARSEWAKAMGEKLEKAHLAARGVPDTAGSPSTSDGASRASGS